MSLFVWLFGKRREGHDLAYLQHKLRRAETEKRQLKEAVKMLSKRGSYESLSLVQARRLMGLNNTAFDNLVARGIVKQHFDENGCVFYDAAELLSLKDAQHA